MNTTFDVLVIGAGVVGCSAAYHMAKKGAKVMVLEKNAIGGEAASLTAGLLAAQAESTGPGPLFDLHLASRGVFGPLADEIAEVSGIETDFEPCGIWRVAVSEEDKNQLLAMRDWQQAQGARVEWWESQPLRDAHPGLGENIGGLYFPDDGQVDSSLWVSALAEACRRKGVRFVDQLAAMDWVRDRRRLAGVRVRGEEYAGDKILFAAGAWTLPILDKLRVSLPLVPVKGQLMVLAGVPRAFRGPVFAEAGYVVPRADGRWVVGTTYEKTGFDARPTLEAQRLLADWAQRWCLGLRDLPVVDFQAGLRPGTVDGAPVMGRLWDFDNVFVASGHFKSGILLSAWCGPYLAEGMLADRWDPLGASFLPSRFREKSL